MDRIARIEHYEALFSEASSEIARLSEALKHKERLGELLSELGKYYESELWREDFEADERGELPKALKRGVLSEDGIYNLLEEYKELSSSF